MMYHNTSQEEATPSPAAFAASETPDIPPVAANEATGRTPSMQDWPGELGFDVRVEQSTRSKDPHYSAAMRKLFVNQKRTVNVLFTVTSVLPHLDVRAVAVYTRYGGMSVKSVNDIRGLPYELSTQFCLLFNTSSPLSAKCTGRQFRIELLKRNYSVCFLGDVFLISLIHLQNSIENSSIF